MEKNGIEKEINSKNDMALLRKLVLCDNEQIIKVMEMYEYDNNRQNLLNSLNNILSKYRGRFSVPNNNTISPEELKLIKKVDKIEKKKKEKIISSIKTSFRWNNRIT